MTSKSRGVQLQQKAVDQTAREVSPRRNPPRDKSAPPSPAQNIPSSAKRGLPRDRTDSPSPAQKKNKKAKRHSEINEDLASVHPVQAGETHTANEGKGAAVQAGEKRSANARSKDVAATNTNEGLPPSVLLIVPHTVRSQLEFWPTNTEYGASFRKMSNDEKLAEVEKANRGPDEENDDVDLSTVKKKAKKSISDIDDDTEDDDEDEDLEESEDDDKTPVKKQPAVSKLLRGRQHKPFSTSGN